MTTSRADDGPHDRIHRHSPATPAIEAVGLRKQFGDVTALDGLDLVAPAGVVTAVLGPNGAGKTTFVRAVATLSAPDGGTLRVAGIDAVAQPDAGPPGHRPGRPGTPPSSRR